MPRPGPRPYECVRRAWHSDRHHPIRGSIIQQIFRVVTEAHSSSTRKNREWQAKLPKVVLKAEEIMYSKANSEGEYVDPETLWVRLNDAVDTIIRRDESTETGQFLQPCIEAALVLGCHPVRASRSQWNSTPRSYLHPRYQEHTKAAPAVHDANNYHRPPPQTPNLPGPLMNLSRSTMGNQASTSSHSTTQMVSNASYIATHPSPYSQPNFPRGPRPMPSSAIESNSSINYGSVYPLYYGSHIQNVDSRFGIQSPQNPNLRNVIVGTPVGWQGSQPPCFASTRNLLPGENAETPASKDELVNSVDSRGKAIELDCDLSLRLGPSDPGVGLGCLTSDGGSSSHREIHKNSESCAKNLEYCFFPTHSGCVPSDLFDNRLEQDDQVMDINTTSRKRKAPDCLELEDGHAPWPKLQHNKFRGQYR